MKKKIIALFAVMTLVVGAFALTGCGGGSSDSAGSEAASSSAAAESDAAYVKDNGKLVVGITDFAPMDYKDDKGEWTGFDAELATLFAKELGVEVEFQEIDWDNKILELDGKSIDCVWNGMTLTDEVKEAMSCTEPYLNNAQIVVVPKADVDKYKDEESIKELTFAVEAGSAGAEVAKEKELKTNEVKDQATALMEVKAGTSDGAIIDSLMAAAMVGEGTDYEDLAYTVGLNEEEYGVGFRKGSDLTDMLNDFFDKCAEDGTLKKLAEKYKVEAALIEDK